MYAESYDRLADLTGFGSFFSQRHFGSSTVEWSDNDEVATRSSSDLPHERAHGVSGLGCGRSNVD